MAWWNFIGDIFKGGKDVAEVFIENKENRGQRSHDREMADISRDMASLSQFSSEFHARQKRTWWDSLVDGLNRLPRPLLTIAILSFFVLAPLDPARFLEIAKAYELMPPGYWALLSVIIGFYFGGRMQLKAQDFTVKKSAVKAAKELISIRKDFRQLNDEMESDESRIYEIERMNSPRTVTNKVVKKWLESR
ncbi:MAG: hypothetical protein CSA49_01930 [Gammaproteobacteria bacterium]|nr:MAG: hypothetical protein CSA49_01930 [Gammaproteobacteria bacterium]